MTQRLTGKYLTLLVSLFEGPMDRIEKLADRVGVSRTTVSKDLKWLSGEIPGSPRRFFRVVPNLNESALGLETIDVFLGTSKLSSIRTLEQLCDAHPYTKYRAQCYGAQTGIFVQYRVPKGTGNYIESFLRKLKTMKIISDYSILPTLTSTPIFSASRLEHWNSKTFTWDFNWEKWAKRKVPSHSKSQVSKESKIHLLDSRDISILTQLSYGARRKHKAIIDALKKENIGISSQDFSRHLTLLNEHFIQGYIVFLDTQAFDLYNNVILTARCDTKFGESLAKRMESNPIPFESTLKVKDDFLLWYLRLPSTHLSTFLKYLQSEVDNLRISILDYLSSEAYGVWSGAFNDTKKIWKTDRKFMVKDPLESL